MNRRHQRTLEAIFEVQASVRWRDIEAMLVALGCELGEGRGSRGAIRALREILGAEGIQP